MTKINKLVLCVTIIALITGCGQDHANDETKSKPSDSTAKKVTRASQESSSKKSSSYNSSSVTESSSSQKKTIESSTLTVSSTGALSGESQEGSASNDSATNSQTFVANADEAVNVLKTHLKEGQDSDIQFEPLDVHKKKDSRGYYYLIREESKELLEKGGSGTVGIYKVYDDYNYQLNE
ncbi:hypothetical protein [Sporolactobacillus nakayamae]|uniref:Lipoprotein n=1 Tax=Sporolactobacillus nakayamae TaxID=269670 RepID=A0A1I2VX53_9BACL|nr:hypothetical protein [Sporolactobacillus nakayamae]SFG92346.1 hypothetical protein SAMN02982927_03244 [Sporolactobacillus nakayamae]